MSDHIKPLLLVGAGPMAVAYAEVLKAQQIPFVVVGRGEASALQFKKQTGIDVFVGGLASYLQRHSVPEKSIVATGVEALEDNTTLLLQAGCADILVEKPGALNLSGVKRLYELAVQRNAKVFIAYNRRCFASVEKAREMIAEDGGLREIYFEFTEWGHVIEPLQKAIGVKEHWFLANSTHVVDLAFHLAGFPRNWKSWTAGGSTWHPSATRFVGSGVTEGDVLFTYQADWEAPGRWGIELVTAKRRLYLRPLEQLSYQQKGHLVINPVSLVNSNDSEYKPGVYVQVKSWLENKVDNLCSISEQLKAINFFYQIAGYKKMRGNSIFV